MEVLQLLLQQRFLPPLQLLLPEHRWEEPLSEAAAAVPLRLPWQEGPLQRREPSSARPVVWPPLARALPSQEPVSVLPLRAERPSQQEQPSQRGSLPLQFPASRLRPKDGILLSREARCPPHLEA